MKLIVLGAGQMGTAAAYDLLRQEDVTALVLADGDPASLQSAGDTLQDARLQTIHLDVTDRPAVEQVMAGAAAVLSAVPYRFNFSLAQAACAAKANFCDLGGNNTIVRQELGLHEPATAAGITIIPDCGLTPGLGGLLLARGIRRFQTVDQATLYVGGLPQQPVPPFNYQLVFSVEGLINEYVEPVTVLREGQVRTLEPMTELETVEFSQPYGTLEAFQTSGGLSTLPETFRGTVQRMDCKTLRYPGYCEKMRAMLALGLGSHDPVTVGGAEVSPRRVFERLLVQHLPREGADVVLLRAVVSGQRDGGLEVISYEMIDTCDEATGHTAMMRTTAFPAAEVALMLARGQVEKKGAVPQERCLDVEAFCAALAGRGITITEQRQQSG